MDTDLSQIVRNGIFEGFSFTAQALGNFALDNINYIAYSLIAVVGLKVGDKLAESIIK